ncbi:hypothetical protein BDK51DRAFT_44028 [Blyttiomyces helicus]|uniref:Uncharacterized protein n=1 Tax=Blyttiomyces helicus TaxID=388810 RepID=A0A4P9W112_9FUNG|nr:hypothetical protein BDK51DRAFT_44028 [Blyttiomyces helicus]|eukprot:RKO83746.1 hypothetical protein BDK51DRAFT_44028 [Blyttiomyces helicus]
MDVAVTPKNGASGGRKLQQRSNAEETSSRHPRSAAANKNKQLLAVVIAKSSCFGEVISFVRAPIPVSFTAVVQDLDRRLHELNFLKLYGSLGLDPEDILALLFEYTAHQPIEVTLAYPASYNSLLADTSAHPPDNALGMYAHHSNQTAKNDIELQFLLFATVSHELAQLLHHRHEIESPLHPSFGLDKHQLRIESGTPTFGYPSGKWISSMNAAIQGRQAFPITRHVTNVTTKGVVLRGLHRCDVDGDYEGEDDEEGKKGEEEDKKEEDEQEERRTASVGLAASSAREATISNKFYKDPNTL